MFFSIEKTATVVLNVRFGENQQSCLSEPHLQHQRNFLGKQLKKRYNGTARRLHFCSSSNLVRLVLTGDAKTYAESMKLTANHQNGSDDAASKLKLQNQAKRSSTS